MGFPQKSKTIRRYFKEMMEIVVIRALQKHLINRIQIPAITFVIQTVTYHKLVFDLKSYVLQFIQLMPHSILQFVQDNPRRCNLKEVKSSLRISFEGIRTIDQAVETLQEMAEQPGVA